MQVRFQVHIHIKMSYEYDEETKLWQRVTGKVDIGEEPEHIALNPHEFNVRTPSGAYIINFGLDGKLYPRSKETIVNNPMEYYYDPTTDIRKFEPLIYWLKQLFPTAASIQKIREILGELMYPQINKNNMKKKITIVNFISGGAKNCKIVQTLFNLLRTVTGTSDVDSFQRVTNSLTSDDVIRLQMRRHRRSAWIRYMRGGRRNRSVLRVRKPNVETVPANVKYMLNHKYVEEEKNNLAKMRFIHLQPCFVDRVKYDEFFKEYLHTIRPKKTIKEYYGNKVVQKQMRLPSFVCVTGKQPMSFNGLGKMRQLANVMTVECNPSAEFNTRSFNRDVDDFKNMLQNWVIHGILERLQRINREYIGFIEAVLEKNVENEVENEPRLYFMQPVLAERLNDALAE